MAILGSGEIMSHLYLSLRFSLFLKDPRVHKGCFYNKSIVIKYNMWGLMCLPCKYFIDFMARNLKLVMFFYLNRIQRSSQQQK